MDEVICLDHIFSTTKMLTQEKPTLENKPTDQFDSVLFLSKSSGRKGEGGLRTKGYFKRSYENKPLISIITVVFNGEQYLEQTIQSVINQNYDNVEYIIIDGGSADETLEIIKKHEDQIDYWVSEKDKGIYDAMNKGIALARGDLIGIINADDYYENNIFEKVAKVYSSQNTNVIYGDLGLLKNEGKEILLAHNTGIRYGFCPYSYYWIWVKMLFGHPTAFMERKIYKQFGLYDTHFKISADYEFFIRVFNKKIKTTYLKEVLAWFRTEGISSTNDMLLQKENYLARKKNNSIIAFVVEVFLRKKIFWKSIS